MSSSSPLKSIARRIVRPFTSPLDGRVADINRRVTDAKRSEAEHSGALEQKLDALRTEVGAYAATIGESNALLGAELRGFEDRLHDIRGNADRQEERLGARIDLLGREGYVERLDHATHMTLEHLDGAVANLVNHANGHRGFAAQAGLWFNPPVTVELSESRARFANVNERIVEIPFAMRGLARLEPPARILDVGASESTFSLAAASLGYRVTALDLHPLPYSHPQLESVAGRFEDWDPKGNRFDAAFLISTIEHVGLGAYGEPVADDDADRALLQRLREEVLDERGLLVLTTPYGAADRNALERTYDDVALELLLEGWDLLERRVALRRDERTWQAVDGEHEGDGARGVVMVLATPAHPR